MKKYVVSLALTALLAASPAFAKESVFAHVFGHLGIASSQFIAVGNVASTGTNQFVMKVDGAAHLDNITNGQATIKIGTKTNIFANDDKKTAMTASDIKVGDKVLVTGNVDGFDLMATTIRILDNQKDNDHKDANKNKIAGKVTAVTSNSVTITNALTGVSTTVSTDGSTKVNVDGQTKSVSDIQVGDSGWVKIKTMGSTLIAKFFHLFR